LRRDAVRSIVFDLDGTLVDSYPAITASLNHARAHWSLPALDPSRVRREVGHGLEQLVAEWVGRERIELGVRLFRERYAELFAERTSLLPRVQETLELLTERHGLTLALASNKPARFSTAILQNLGLADRFAAIHGPDTIGSTKPDPAMIRRCIAEMNSEPAASLYVGDMVLDVESATRAAVPVVLVCGGSSSAAQLRATGEVVLQGLEELPELLT